MDQLETLTLNNNPALAYFHPGAVAAVPRLVALDLTMNNLSAMEDIQPYIPSLRTLYLKGNPFRCHCGLRWLQRTILEPAGFSIEDGDDVTCNNRTRLTSMAVAETPCGPYILPLFPAAQGWKILCCSHGQQLSQ